MESVDYGDTNLNPLSKETDATITTKILRKHGYSKQEFPKEELVDVEDEPMRMMTDSILMAI